MFLGIVFLVIGIALLLNSLGFISVSFWGFLWAALFIILGIKMLMGKEHCCLIGSHMKRHDHDCCGGEHNHEA